MDTEFFGNLLLLGCINLSEEHWWVLFGEGLGSGDILWGKLLAMATMVKIILIRIMKESVSWKTLHHVNILTTMGHRIQPIRIRVS